MQPNVYYLRFQQTIYDFEFFNRAKRGLVFLGAHEIKNAKEMGQIRLRVTHNDFTIFPTWNPKRLKDDIAIVRLPETVEFSGKLGLHMYFTPIQSKEYCFSQNPANSITETELRVSKL